MSTIKASPALPRATARHADPARRRRTTTQARKVYNGMIDKRPRADRALRRRGRRDRRGELRPRQQRCCSRFAAAATTAAAWASATTAW